MVDKILGFDLERFTLTEEIACKIHMYLHLFTFSNDLTTAFILVKNYIFSYKKYLKKQGK